MEKASRDKRTNEFFFGDEEEPGRSYSSPKNAPEMHISGNFDQFKREETWQKLCSLVRKGGAKLRKKVEKKRRFQFGDTDWITETPEAFFFYGRPEPLQLEVIGFALLWVHSQGFLTVPVFGWVQKTLNYFDCCRP